MDQKRDRDSAGNIIRNGQAEQEQLYLSRLNTALVKARENEEIIHSLAKIYAMILHLNLDTEKYKVIQGVDAVTDILGTDGWWNDKVQAMLNYFVDPAFFWPAADFFGVQYPGGANEGPGYYCHGVQIGRWTLVCCPLY